MIHVFYYPYQKLTLQETLELNVFATKNGDVEGTEYKEEFHIRK